MSGWGRRSSVNYKGRVDQPPLPSYSDIAGPFDVRPYFRLDIPTSSTA